MNKLDIKELQNRLDAIGEAETIEIDGRDFDQEDFNLAHAVTILGKKLLAKAGESKNRRYDPEAEYYAAADYYGYDLEEVSMIQYDQLSNFDMEDFMEDYKEPPVVRPDAIKDEEIYRGYEKRGVAFQNQPAQRDKVESVEEGDAELAELKDIMGRSGVMGLKF